MRRPILTLLACCLGAAPLGPSVAEPARLATPVLNRFGYPRGDSLVDVEFKTRADPASILPV